MVRPLTSQGEVWVVLTNSPHSPARSPLFLLKELLQSIISINSTLHALFAHSKMMNNKLLIINIAKSGDEVSSPGSVARMKNDCRPFLTFRFPSCLPELSKTIAKVHIVKLKGNKCKIYTAAVHSGGRGCLSTQRMQNQRLLSAGWGGGRQGVPNGLQSLLNLPTGEALFFSQFFQLRKACQVN